MRYDAHGTETSHPSSVVGGTDEISSSRALRTSLRRLWSLATNVAYLVALPTSKHQKRHAAARENLQPESETATITPKSQAHV